MAINIDNLYFFYLGLLLFLIAIVLMALPTILHNQIEEAAKKLNEQRAAQAKA